MLYLYHIFPEKASLINSKKELKAALSAAFKHLLIKIRNEDRCHTFPFAVLETAETLQLTHRLPF